MHVPGKAASLRLYRDVTVRVDTNIELTMHVPAEVASLKLYGVSMSEQTLISA